MRRLLLFFLILLLQLQLIAQDKEKEENPPHHSISIVLGHAGVFQGRDENGKRKTLLLPLWGIDYNYHFNHRWAIGLQTDIIIEEFVIEKNGGEEIERSYPVAPALVATFSPWRHWGFLLGTGVEFEAHENFFLMRTGIEYSAELPKEWEVFGKLGYDIKWDAYDTWTINIGIVKFFGKRQGRKE